MELAHLATFASIYRTGNLTRAANDLYLSQPAVSSHLKALEAAVGTALFERKARGVVPTPAAHQLADEVIGPLRSLQNAGANLTSAPAPFSSVLRLGGPVDGLATRIIPALGPLIERGLRVRASFGDSVDLVDRLADGDLDLVVSTRPVRRAGVVHRPLFDETLVLIAGPVVRTRLGRPDADALATEPMIAFADDRQLIRRYFRHTFAAAPPQRPVVVAGDLRAVVAAVAADIGWSVVPAYIAEAMGETELVLTADGPPARNTILLSTLADAENASVEGVCDHLLASSARWSETSRIPAR